MIILRLLPLICLVSTTFAISIPLCRQSRQGENLLGNEICLCSSGSHTIVDSLDIQHLGVERLVIVVYRKPSGEIVMLIPEKKYQRRIPDFPEDYGIIQDVSNNPSIVETFENSPSKDIRNRKPFPYPSDKYPERDDVGPNGIRPKPEKENGEIPNWQIPVPSDHNQPGPNNEIPGTNEYETPYQKPENNDYPTPGGSEYQEPEPNVYPSPYYSPDIHGYQTPQPNNYQPPYQVPEPYQTPETNNYQPPYEIPEPNNYQSPYDIPGPYGYQTQEPNNYQLPYRTPETNDYPPPYWTPETNDYQPPYQTPDPNNYQPPYQLPEPNDYPPPYYNPDTNGNQISEQNSKEPPYQTPDINGYQTLEPNDYPPPYYNPDTNGNQISEPNNKEPPYQTPDINGYQTLEPNDYPLPYDTPGTNQNESPETNNNQSPYNTPRPHEYQTPESYDYHPPRNDEYESPENTNNQSPYRPGMEDYVNPYQRPGHNDNEIPQTNDIPSPYHKPSVTNNKDNAYESDVTPNYVPHNSEEQYYPEHVPNEGVPNDNVTEPNQIHTQPFRPNENYPDPNDEKSDDRDVHAPTKIPKVKRIGVPIKDKNGKIIGWKPRTPKNNSEKDTPQFIDNEAEQGTVPSFDNWLKQQLRITTLSGNRIPTSTGDITALHKALQNVLLQNGFVVTTRGTLIDGYGKVISLANLKLRPIFIGKSVSYDSFIKQSSVNETPTEAPFLEGLLLTMIKPAKILGIVPLKITSLPSTYKFDGNRGEKNAIHGNKLYSEGQHKTSFKVLPLEHLVSFRKGSNRASGSKKRGSKSKSRKIGHMNKSRDSAFLKQALGKISKPGKIKERPRDKGLEKPGVSEEKPDFRIIGGISATVSGTPLLFKGRSGRE